MQEDANPVALTRGNVSPRKGPPFDRNFLLVTIVITAVILHGSLYPYDFHDPLRSTGPVGTLLRSWAIPPTSFGDFIANILLYVPFGFFGVLAIRTRRRLLFVTLTGLALCTFVELAQFYDAGRVTNMSDIYLNTFGTWLGGMAASVVRIQSASPLLRAMSDRPVPFILLIAMLGYHLFPYVPTIDLHKYWNSLKPLFFHPVASPFFVFRYFALWLTVSFLVSDATDRDHPRFYVLFFAAFTFMAKILIVDQSVSLPEIIGASLAILLWFVLLEGRSRAPGIVALVLCTMIVVSRLEPFKFHAGPVASFGWLPFQGYLTGSLAINVQSFFEKSFLYGSLVWIAARAGLPLWFSTGASAALILATSTAEIYLPGRSPEITDTLMVLIVGGIFAAIVHAQEVGNSPA